MTFVTNVDSKFAKVFDKSKYSTSEPIVKVNHIQRGNNIIVGSSSLDTSNLLYLGKIYENTPGKNYLGADIWLNASFPHVIYITGTRGSGKSFDLGVILEGINSLSSPNSIQQDISPTCSFLIDTQSQFWTLKYEPNIAIKENAQQISDLSSWNIGKGKLKNCNVYIPIVSEKITGTEIHFSLRPCHITLEEWCSLINEDVYSPQGYVLRMTLESFSGTNFGLDDMISYISDGIKWPNVQESTRSAVLYKLDAYNKSRLFCKNGLSIDELLRKDVCNVFMLRDLSDVDKSLVCGLLARQIFVKMGKFHKEKRINQFFEKGTEGGEYPNRVWLLIDEAHVIAPSSTASPAKDALIEYVKRGRDAGLSLVLATQQPSAIDDRILSQVNLTFSHRLSFQNDITAAMNRIPTKLLKSIKFSGVDIDSFGDMLRYLEAGECFIGDHNTSRVLLAKIRPRITSHGGFNPE